MGKDVIVVFTGRGLDELISDGGSKAWKLDDRRARQCAHLICVQNLKGGDWGRPTHAQGQAFMVARVSGVESVADKKPGRFIIRFESYAEIDIPDFWPGLRNPVHYMTLKETGIEVDKLTFTPIESPSKGRPLIPNGMDMTEAKKALSEFYKVPVSAIEITIRG